MKLAMGVDVGGTNMRAAVGTRSGRLLAEAARPTPRGDGRAGAAALTELIKQVAATAGVSPADLVGIGLGTPGPMDTARGLLLNPPNLKWGNLPLRELLCTAFECPVYLINDCKAAGIGELRYGAGIGLRQLIYVGVGSGVGGCIIVDGQIQAGATGNAGEIGHMVLALDGPLCACGQRGCLEALASGTAIARLGKEAARRGEAARLLALAGGQWDAITGEHVALAAQEEDPAAGRILAGATRALGIGIASLMNLLGPERIILGGGVAVGQGPAYVQQVGAIALAHVLPGCGAEVVPAALGARSGVLGALAMAWERAPHSAPYLPGPHNSTPDNTDI